MLSESSAAAARPAAWRVRQFRNEVGAASVGSVEPYQGKVPKDSIVLRSLPATIKEGPGTSSTRFEEIVYSDKSLPPGLRARAVAEPHADWPGSEVRTIVSSGQIANRINLTIVGDGYTAAEKDRFFADAQSTANKLFGLDTFQSYLPLFNVHAVFVPSNQSGLTDGDNKKDTALGLYRDPAGSKRGIMPPDDTTNVDRAIALAPATDYPILMANDDFYGGLGGQYAITTRSDRSGIVVLRHELGHNFGNVGEEYDGGSAYLGANHSDEAQVPWTQWIGGPGGGPAQPHVFECANITQQYPWQNLQSGPVTVPLEVPASATGGAAAGSPRPGGPAAGNAAAGANGPAAGNAASRANGPAAGNAAARANGPAVGNAAAGHGAPGAPQIVRIEGSFVGWETPQDSQILIDGKPVPYQTPGGLTNDRGFWNVGEDQPLQLTPGTHQLTVQEQVHDGDNVFANVSAWAYPPDYDFTKGKVDAFATFDDSGNKVGYRPTHDACLMRDMLTTKFCSIDRENMWHRFLEHVSLIDGVDVNNGKDGQPGVTVRTPALNGLDVRWYRLAKDGSEQELESLRGQRSWTPAATDGGNYRVRVSFATPEVRVYDDKFQGAADFKV
jgi:hypothetical protein